MLLLPYLLLEKLMLETLVSQICLLSLNLVEVVLLEVLQEVCGVSTVARQLARCLLLRQAPRETN